MFRKKIKIPKGIEIDYFEDRACIKGTKASLFSFIETLRSISKLKSGTGIKLGELILKVSKAPTFFGMRSKSIEMPSDAWNILASKFYDVWEGFDENPFYFNDCGYLYPKNEYDLGILITDMPKNQEA